MLRRPPRSTLVERRRQRQMCIRDRNQYLIPIAINSNEENYVLSQGLASFATKMGYEVDFGALFASVTLTVIPVLVVYVIFQRQLHGSVSQGTMK